MADTKISALTSGNPAQSTDEIPVARSGANFKITAGSIAALGGDVDGPASSVDNQIALFDSTSGKLIKAATTTGLLKASSGVIAAASAGTDYAAATTGTNAQLLANDGSGGFANVTVGSGLSLAAGTLTATGGGGGGLTWQSVQTTGFTAVAGNAYPCNTTSAAFTVTLPASPSVGDQVQLLDYAGTWATNNVTVARGGSNINGVAVNAVLAVNRSAVTLTYVDSTQGWVGSNAIAATSVPQAPTPSVDYLVVAGGGGGGDSGGGGAGGFRTGTGFSVIAGTGYTITVGSGGSGGPNDQVGANGSNSVFSTITSTGGGGGGAYNVSNGKNGGSGGGGSGSIGASGAGGTGNTPSVSPSQGNNGGAGTAPFIGGGGGGASAAGNAGSGSLATGGSGTLSAISGASVYYAGGGGGGGSQIAGTNNTSGGQGGGGTGNATDASGLKPGMPNTGGGGGGSDGGSGQGGGAGGSGIVIISYPDIYRDATTTGSPTVTTSGGNRIYKFTGNGSITF